jgi:hypothetical protein
MNAYLILGAFLLGLALGALGEYKWHMAAETVDAQHETATAQKGEANIIHDTQVIYRTIHDSKDKCAGATVPRAVNEQLR